MGNIERGVLIEILERAKAIEVLRREDSTSLIALVSAFRSLSPAHEALYNTHRRRVEQLQSEHPSPDPVDAIQTLIDRLKELPPTEKPKPN